jgi:hypothetical protein
MDNKMKFLQKNSKVSNGFILATLLSIVGSIVIWNTAGVDPAHIERLALFVGLWAPTFMGFANYYSER